MRIEKEAGTVEEGKRADLIVLDADPLSDPAIFADPAHVRIVMLGGDIVKDLDAASLPSPGGEGKYSLSGGG
jgi:imidazolonepropionase-like amidohydrolase